MLTRLNSRERPALFDRLRGLSEDDQADQFSTPGAREGIRAIRVPTGDQDVIDAGTGEAQILGRSGSIGAAAAQPPIESAATPAALGSPVGAEEPNPIKIAKPASGPRAINVPPVQDELTRSMMPSPVQSAQENLNHENSVKPAIWRPGGIKNPILRAMARGADVVGTAMFPAITAQIPGTALHHKLEVAGAQNRLNQAESDAEKEAQTQKLLNPDIKTAFQAWRAQHPNEDVEKFFEAQQNAKPDKNPTEFGEWRKANPDAPLSQWFDLKNNSKPDTSAEADSRYRSIEQKLLQKQEVSPEDQAWARAYEKGKTLGPVTSAALAAPGKNDARSDRSYQFNSGQLEKVGAPVDQAIQRLGRLQDTLAQGNPQADALVAPELLTIMAGGAGSGLRMNEAEISRVVGGRSNWESLKASMNKWKLDPNAARSITPAQQKQIEALVGEVQKKLVVKQSILDEARQALIDEDDPHKHRQIVTDARKKLDAIDAGTQQGAGIKTATQQQIQDYATAKRISVQQATEEFKNSGYKIQ